MRIDEQIPAPLDHDPDKLRETAKAYREKGGFLQHESLRYIRLADIYEELADLVSGEVSAASLRRRLFRSRLHFDEPEREREEPVSTQWFHSMLKPSRTPLIAEATEPLFMRGDWLEGMTYADAAYAVLHAMGHPMTTSELLEALQKGGRPVGGKQPISTLGTTIRRDERFIRTQEGAIDILREEGVDDEE